MLQTKNSIKWPCSFQKEVKIVKEQQMSYNDRQRPIAMGHLSVSGELKNTDGLL